VIGNCSAVQKVSNNVIKLSLNLWSSSSAEVWELKKTIYSSRGVADDDFLAIVLLLSLHMTKAIDKVDRMLRSSSIFCFSILVQKAFGITFDSIFIKADPQEVIGASWQEGKFPMN
jgi:hypothetical protein